MIGLDTNVIVRYIMQDDPVQTHLANELMETSLSLDAPGYITLVVLAETIWVLKTVYDIPKDGLLKTIESILETRQLKVERSDVVIWAMKAYKKGKADFSDALIASAAKSDGCESVVTFDRKATSIGMTLIGGK